MFDTGTQDGFNWLQSTVGCFPEQLTVAVMFSSVFRGAGACGVTNFGLWGCENNFDFPTWACAAIFNNNNNNIHCFKLFLKGSCQNSDWFSSYTRSNFVSTRLTTNEKSNPQ